MKVILKEKLIVLVPETATEEGALAVCKAGMDGHVALFCSNSGAGISLHDLGTREVAFNEPINVSSRSADPAIRLIGNFAPTPFEMDGRHYQSVESFWQGLKFEDREE